MYKNTRKKPGAYVWHKGELKRITSQKLQSNKDIILENSERIGKDSIRLAKVGDVCLFRNTEVLPERDRHGIPVKISWFLDNDLVGYAESEHSKDTIHYSYLTKCA